jgi:hypothetical protein
MSMNVRALLNGIPNIRSSMEHYQRTAKEAEETARWYATLYALVGRIHESWADKRPGMDQPHTFFVRHFLPHHGKGIDGLTGISSAEPFWLREHVGDDQRIVATGSLSDITRGECRKCRCDAPLVGSYERTFAGLKPREVKERWVLTVHAICIGCPEITPVARRRERFDFLAGSGPATRAAYG